jgi:beta-lactamase class A
VSYRGEDRFAYCSTFKWVLGAAILRRVDEGRLRLDQPVHYTEKDLLEPCTLTRAHLQEGQMSVGELCAATITTSDNAAANLLEPLVGGPSGLQSFVRGLGDPTMRFDRLEPELNSNHSGDPRDTTSPKAMTGLLRAALETDALSRRSRTRLLEWMKAVVTGSNRIPAALPRGWILGHKTGTGSLGAANDVAVIFPPAGPPIYLCIFTDGDRANLDRHEAAIAEIARLVLKVLG